MTRDDLLLKRNTSRRKDFCVCWNSGAERNLAWQNPWELGHGAEFVSALCFESTDCVKLDVLEE